MYKELTYEEVLKAKEKGKCKTCKFHEEKNNRCKLLNRFDMEYCSKWETK